MYLGGRRTGLLPHSNGDYFGGGGTDPPPHNVGKFLSGAVLAQMGRPGDTMICEMATFYTRVQVGTARDALRYHAVGVWSSRAMRGWVARLGRFGDTIRLGRNGAAAQMGRSGDTMVCEKATFCTRELFVPLGTFRDTMRRVCKLFVTVGTLRRYLPFGSVCTRWLGWTLHANEVLHLFVGSIQVFDC